MSPEVYIPRDSDFARVVGQAAVEAELRRHDRTHNKADICTTMREGAKLGAAIAINVLSDAGVTINVDDIEEATRIAQEMNQVDQDKGDD